MSLDAGQLIKPLLVLKMISGPSRKEKHYLHFERVTQNHPPPRPGLS